MSDSTDLPKPPSNRLDSLSRRTPSASPAARGGLKFKPKTVARRSKEERDADAPVMVEARPLRGRGGMRGRGARGGRGGRGGMAGTHIVSTGPLASGDVFTSRVAPSRAYSSSPTPDYISGLKLKTESVSRGTYEDGEDDLDDPTRIDMSKEYRFDDEETVFFPVRALRVEPSPEPEAREVSPVKMETEDVRSVSPEPVEEEELDEARIEIIRLESDHAKLSKMMRLMSVLEEVTAGADPLPVGRKFVLFQLPKQLPVFDAVPEATDLVMEAEPAEGETLVKEEAVTEKATGEGASEALKSEVDAIPGPTEPPAKAPKTGLEGKVGSLRFHKSGRISMKLGNVVMDVERGAKANFLQSVVLVNRNSTENRVYSLGDLEEKLIVTPRFY